MNRIFFIMIMSLLLFFSCRKKNNSDRENECEIIDVTKSVNKSYIELSDSFNIKLIRLETKPECLIGNIDKVIVYKNKFYIEDKSVSHQIYVFNEDGKYLYKVGKNGRGPKDYLVLNDISIFENKVYVYSAAPRRITVYDLDGKFLKKIKLSSDAMGVKFSILDNGFFVTYDGNGVFNLNYWKSNGKLIKRYGVLVNKGINYSLTKVNSYHKGKLYVKPTFGDTIYEVESNGYYPKYYFEFKDPFPVWQIKNKVVLDKIEKQNHNYNEIIDFSVSDNYLFYRYVDGKDIIEFGMINLKTKTSYTANIFLVYGVNLFKIRGDAENGPILVMEPHIIIDMINDNRNNKFLKFHPEMYKIKKNDNPVILVFDEKK